MFKSSNDVLISANTAGWGRVMLQDGIVPYPFLENILVSVPFKVILQVLLVLKQRAENNVSM